MELIVVVGYSDSGFDVAFIVETGITGIGSYFLVGAERAGSADG